MPVYEYECKNCGQRFDKIQPVTADTLTECLLCGKGPIRRVFQPVGVIFKGSGWYSTDNRTSSKGGSSSGSSGSGSAESKSSGDEGKSKTETSSNKSSEESKSKSDTSSSSSNNSSKSSEE